MGVVFAAVPKWHSVSLPQLPVYHHSGRLKNDFATKYHWQKQSGRELYQTYGCGNPSRSHKKSLRWLEKYIRLMKLKRIRPCTPTLMCNWISQRHWWLGGDETYCPNPRYIDDLAHHKIRFQMHHAHKGLWKSQRTIKSLNHFYTGFTLHLLQIAFHSGFWRNINSRTWQHQDVIRKDITTFVIHCQNETSKILLLGTINKR